MADIGDIIAFPYKAIGWGADQMVNKLGVGNDAAGLPYMPQDQAFQLLYGQQNQERAGSMYDRIGARGTPTIDAAQIDRSRDQEARAQQMALIEAMQARARGEAPSAAALGARAGMDNNMQSAAMQLAQARGLSPAAALAATQRGLGANNMATSTAAGMQAMSEQDAAQRAALGMAGQARGLDMEAARAQAILQQQAAAANQQATLRAREQMDRGQLATTGLSADMDQAQIAALMERERQQANSYAAWQARMAAVKAANDQLRRQIIGGTIGTIGTGIGFAAGGSSGAAAGGQAGNTVGTVASAGSKSNASGSI